MLNFDFELYLNYEDELFEIIKPPSSFNELVEVAKHCFDLTKLRLYYKDEDDEPELISTDSDYIKALDLIESSNEKQGEIYIEGDRIKRKKSTSLRYFDADGQTDLRNKKQTHDENPYSKHGYNKNNMRRIGYIKEKKDMQREENRLRELELGKKMSEIQEKEERENEGNKKKKEKRKNEYVFEENGKSHHGKGNGDGHGKKKKNKGKEESESEEDEVDEEHGDDLEDSEDGLDELGYSKKHKNKRIR